MSSATYNCNREFLRELRERKGWTQADLAKAAGYSDRLITKAESGASISIRTVEDLAGALSDSQKEVFWEDLVCDPVSLAKRYNEALYTKQEKVIDHILDFLDEDVVFRIPGDPDELPFAGVHRGIDEVRRGYEIFFSMLEVPKNHDFRKHYRYIAQGPNAVIWGDSWIHPIGQPLEKPIRVSVLMRFRRGKLILFDDRFDTQQAKVNFERQMEELSEGSP